MSANRNSLPQIPLSPTQFQPRASLPGFPCLNAHHFSAHAHESPGCCFASAFVPLPDENRDGGRSFFRFYTGKANSVSPVPARIALQGGETREHRCDISLPRLSFTRSERCVPALRKRRAIRGLWPLSLLAAPGTDPRQTCLPGSPVTRHPLAHTDRRVLAEPFKDNK